MVMIALAWLLGIGVALGSGDPEIGPGDSLRIEVLGHDFGEPTHIVNSEGLIHYPYVGLIKLSGLTAFEAQQAIRAALMDGYLVDPQVTVRAESYRSQQVDVIGAVTRPGQYGLDGPTTVRTLVALAGGAQSAADSPTTSRASGVVTITRGSEVVLRIPLSALEGPEGSFMVIGGDVVDIDLGQAVFFSGEVVKPGVVPFVPGLTITQALLQAGGKSKYGRLSGTYIVREQERIPVNLRKIMRGRAADLELSPGDRVVVPMSAL